MRNLIYILTALTLTLVACSEAEQEQVEEQVKQAGEQAAETTEQAVEETAEALDEATPAAKQALESAQEETANALDKVDELLPANAPALAVASLSPTEGNQAKGTVFFVPAKQGKVKVLSKMTGLPPGKHGYHIHLFGDCTAPDGTSAGTHFNFQGSSQDPPEDIDRITGNLGDIEADENGDAGHQNLIEHAEFIGPKSIIGRAVIVHAKPNDPSQPPIGAAGARLACGVIGVGNFSAHSRDLGLQE